jgi:DNA-binding MarR family transcriptional regulator
MMLSMEKDKQIETVRNGLRHFNRKAGVLKSDPYGIGLSLSHCSALIDIERHGTIKPNELTTLLLLDKSTVSRLLSNLVAKDLIRTSNDTDDGRGKVLTLTSKGKKLVEVINEVSNDSVLSVFKNLTPQEKQTVVTAFQLISKAIDRQD